MNKNIFRLPAILAATLLTAQLSIAQTSVNPGVDPNEAVKTSGNGTEGGVSSCNPGLPSYCAQCCEYQKSQLRLTTDTTYRPGGTSAPANSSSQDGAQ